jgi:hypothetical protein
MSAATPPPRPPCGLTQEKVLALDERNRVPVVGGLCQNLRPDRTVCDCPISAHPSETAPAGKMTPPHCYIALSLH